MNSNESEVSRRRPLKRFRVLDLTNARSGPVTVRQLSDWGADVIRVERKISDQINEGLISRRHGGDFQNLHRNKRSIGLDLKTPEGLEIFYRLVEDADVLVENMRPDVKHRLHIDYETLRKLNPRLVYASISGYGQDGPHGQRGLVDQVAQGISGLMSVTGDPEAGPTRVGIAISDVVSGTFLTQGILIALLDRERSGTGTWVKTSLLESMVNILDNQAMRYLMDGEIPGAVGNDHPRWVPMGTFEAADGELINIFASSQRLFPRFCKAAGLEELLSDRRFTSPESRVEHGKALRTIVAERLKQKSAGEWVEQLNEVGVPCGPVLNIRQMFEDPQVAHLGVTRTLQHPDLGEIRLLANPIDIDGASKDLELPTPEIGQHSCEILAELGYDEESIQFLCDRKVIDVP